MFGVEEHFNCSEGQVRREGLERWPGGGKVEAVCVFVKFTWESP